MASISDYDIETLLQEVKQKLITHLNTYIGLMNTKKSDSLVLSTVNDLAYYMISLDLEVVNYDPFVFIGMSLPATESIQGKVATRVAIDVELVHSIHNHAQVQYDDVIRSLRYHQVLKNLFEQQTFTFNTYNNVVFESLEPINFSLHDESEFYRTTGIRLQINFN